MKLVITILSLTLCLHLSSAPAAEKDTPVKNDHWAFQQPTQQIPPGVNNETWPQNPIDNFILTQLEEKNIKPSPEANRITLIRRLSLDLLGLPPSLEEVDQFLVDDRPNAYEQLVDRLLASPHYGERWGRHWLDLARYADSNGYTRDFPRPIWKYREWVINAFNQDLPFDQFTLEQIAGDLLPNATLNQKIATGFHRNTLFNEEGGTDPEEFRNEAVVDRIDTTGSVFLGVTIGCARCHDHKYDPFTQKDYYQLFAFLNNCDEPLLDAPSSFQIELGELERRTGIRDQISKLNQKIELDKETFTRKQLEWEKSITGEQRASFLAPVQSSLALKLEKRSDEQKKLVEETYMQSEIARKTFPLVEEIYQLRSREPDIPMTMVMTERKMARQTHVQKRGNFLDKGIPVSANVPAILHPLKKKKDRADRIDLARWLTDPANPLTPRVIVNRFWQRFFGRGIVETQNDFGIQGSPPTHPELLDWLALKLIQGNWSMKSIHRLIVTSSTYRQLSHQRPDLENIDANNKLLARQNRLRMEAEIIRDLSLTASGVLSRKIGGPPIFPPQPDGVFDFTQDKKDWKAETTDQRFRRGLYIHLWRSSLYPSLAVFDFPGSNITCTRRSRSNTPLQALTLANDQAFMECAQHLARRVLGEDMDGDTTRAQFAFRLCMARAPGETELERLVQLVQQQRTAYRKKPQEALELIESCASHENNNANMYEPIELAAWTTFSRVLMNLDEFITRE